MDRTYESMLILKPDLGEAEQQDIFDKIIKKIASLEGKVLDSKIWEKDRNLYYFLRGRGADRKKYYKGSFWLLNFILDRGKVLDLKEIIRLEERILRSLIINREGYKKISVGKS